MITEAELSKKSETDVIRLLREKLTDDEFQIVAYVADAAQLDTALAEEASTTRPDLFKTLDEEGN